MAVAFAANPLSPEETVFAALFVAARGAFLRDGIGPAVAAARAGDSARLAEVLHETMPPLYEPIHGNLNALIAFQDEASKGEYEAMERHFGRNEEDWETY